MMSAIRVRTPGNLPYTKLYCDWADRQGGGCHRNTAPPGGFDARDARKAAKALGYTRVEGKDYCPDHQCVCPPNEWDPECVAHRSRFLPPAREDGGPVGPELDAYMAAWFAYKYGTPCIHGYGPQDHHWERGLCMADEYMRTRLTQQEVGKVEWFRNSYGVIVNGIGWEIARDTDDSDGFDSSRPWSLWHHGEYVGNYETVEAAKADAVPVDCSKCADLA